MSRLIEERGSSNRLVARWDRSDLEALREHAHQVRLKGLSAIAEDGSSALFAGPFSRQDRLMVARDAACNGALSVAAYAALVEEIAEEMASDVRDG